MELASDATAAVVTALKSVPIEHLLALVCIAAFALAAFAMHVVVTLTKRRNK